MEQFLTSEIEEKFNKTRLQFVYDFTIHFGDREKNQISSTSLEPHFIILKKMIEKGIVPYDATAWQYLQQRAIFGAIECYTKMGNMIAHIEKDEDFCYYAFYCPTNIQEFHKLNLRLWNEYCTKKKVEYGIKYFSQNGVVDFSKENQINSFLEEQQILDDDYIRTLTKKYPLEDHL